VLDCGDPTDATLAPGPADQLPGPQGRLLRHRQHGLRHPLACLFFIRKKLGFKFWIQDSKRKDKVRKAEEKKNAGKINCTPRNLISVLEIYEKDKMDGTENCLTERK